MSTPNMFTFTCPSHKSQIVRNVMLAGKRKWIGLNFSELIVAALEYFWGTDLLRLEYKLLTLVKGNAYHGILTPKIHRRFDRMLAKALQEKSIVEIAFQWNLSKHDLARLLYAYAMRELE